MPAPTHLSISQIGMFMRCPAQWMFRYIEGLTVPPSAASIKGKATHEGVELIYSEKKETGVFSPSSAVQKAVEFIDHADGIENWGPKGKDDARDTVAISVGHYIKEGLPDRVQQDQIEEIEKEAIWSGVSPAGRIFEMKGYADLVLRDTIIDFKTATMRKKKDGLHALQVGFYAMSMGKENCELQTIVTTKAPGIQIDSGSLGSTLPNVKRIIGTAHDAIEDAKKSGNFPANGIFHTWACGYCGYGETGMCPDYKLRGTSHD